MFNMFKGLDERSNKMIVMIAVVVVMAILAAYVYSRKREMFEDANKPKVEYFYMTGCPWCDKFSPEWDKFVTAATAAGIDTQKYEASEAPEKVSKYGITGFPSIFITKNGTPTEYKGDRTSEALLQAVKA